MINSRKLLRPRVRFAAAAWCAIGLVLVLTCCLIAIVYQQGLTRTAQKRAQEQRERVLVLQQAARGAPMSAEEVKQWQRLRADREFPWDRVFAVIEATAMIDIELLEFAPDRRHGMVLLRGEAKTNAALIAYIDALSALPQLHRVYLVRRSEVEGNNVVRIEFEIRGSVR